ncbi:tetratricopeptide repeat protein [Emcibacter nanhaiensis]|uniref:Sel1 repeat family protein n=1 Tax=Emcibacter nanhaiensis TaxID=1505037 RepID=A0A501PHQ0_9PROT|nr:tetratricopeptide repeat protein [Emcibacter nanhaiensis]TPD59464.1 sel1 repeat family protein [Emcibacter nanhaiensis]
MKKLNLLILIAPLLLTSCTHKWEYCASDLPISLRSMVGSPRLGEVEGQEQLFKYYKCRAEHDDEEAMYRTGLAYELGIGVPINYKKAMKYYFKAGDRANGMEYDYYLTNQFLKLPLDKGHAEAQYRLGLMFMEGRGKKQSYRVARRWFKDAAERGHDDARKMYEMLLQKLEDEATP